MRLLHSSATTPSRVLKAYSRYHTASCSSAQHVIASVWTDAFDDCRAVRCRTLSRASAAAFSTVLKTTALYFANMRFSGTCPAETPQPIKMKFRTIDYVGEITRCAKNGYNRLAGGGPTDKWNITSNTFLTIHYTLPYFTLLYLLFL
jgi:hypothetical protein